jgi:hypothetical protein
LELREKILQLESIIKEKDKIIENQLILINNHTQVTNSVINSNNLIINNVNTTVDANKKTFTLNSYKSPNRDVVGLRSCIKKLVETKNMDELVPTMMTQIYFNEHNPEISQF